MTRLGLVTGFVLALVVFLAAFVVACWDDDEEDEGELFAQSDLLRIERQAGLTDFRAVETTDSWNSINGGSRSVEEILYKSPGTWSFRYLEWHSDAGQPPTFEHSQTAVVEGRTWRLVAGRWQDDDFGIARLKAGGLVLGLELSRDEAVDDGDGPIIQGEPTRRARLHEPDYGANVIKSVTGSSGERFTMEVFKDATSSIELVIGKTSGRIYFFRQFVEGPNVRQEHTITFEYGGDIRIENPRR